MPWVPQPPEDETAAAAWYADGLVPWPEADGSVRVRSFVPSGFETYLAVAHPGVEGELPLNTWLALVHHLRDHTATPGRVFHAAWDGRHPATLPVFASMPRLAAPHRTYLVFLGELTGPGIALPDGTQLVANAWWPDDRAWCIVTDIDAAFTCIGCSRSCAEALLADDGLVVRTIELSDRVDGAGGLRS